MAPRGYRSLGDLLLRRAGDPAGDTDLCTLVPWMSTSVRLSPLCPLELLCPLEGLWLWWQCPTAMGLVLLGWAKGSEVSRGQGGGQRAGRSRAGTQNLCQGNGQPCRSWSWPRALQTWSRAVCRCPHGMWLGQGRCQGVGGGCKGRRAMVGRDPEDAISIVMGGAPPSPECALPCAVPWQHGCGTMCGAVGLGRCRNRALKGATKELAGCDSKDRLQNRNL